MSMQTLETKILNELKHLAGNSQIKKNDMLEWTCGDNVKVGEGEMKVHLSSLGIYVVIDQKLWKKELTSEKPGKAIDNATST